MPKCGCVVLVVVPFPLPLVTCAVVVSAGVVVSVCGGDAVAFGNDEMPRVPHGLCGGIAVRLSHPAVDEEHGVARRGAGATSTADNVVDGDKGARGKDQKAAAGG